MDIRREDCDIAFSVKVCTTDELYGLMRQFMDIPATLYNQTSLRFRLCYYDFTDYIDLDSFISAFVSYVSQFFLSEVSFAKIEYLVTRFDKNQVYALCVFLINYIRYNKGLESCLHFTDTYIVIPKWMVENSENKNIHPLRYTLQKGDSSTIRRLLNGVKDDSVDDLEIIDGENEYRIKLHKLIYRVYDGWDDIPIILDQIILTQLPRFI